MWVMLLDFLEPLWAAFSRLLFSKGGQWVASILVFLGISFATNQYAEPAVRSYLEQGFGGLPASAAAWVGYLGIDVYCSIIVSAYAAALVKGMIMKRISA